MSNAHLATALVAPFEQLRMTDVEAVGGKNASLGEMISQLPQGVRVPTGFATTAHAFRRFLQRELPRHLEEARVFLAAHPVEPAGVGGAAK